MDLQNSGRTHSSIDFFRFGRDKTSSESPPSINDGFCSCHVGRLQEEKNFWLFLNLKALITCRNPYKDPSGVSKNYIMEKKRVQWSNTHLIWGQVHTQMCHFLCCAHSTSLLSGHKVFKSLRGERQREMTERLTGWTVCLYD